MTCSNKSLKSSDFAYSGPEKVASVNDLIFEILLRLDTRTLLRSKSISKQWQSVVKDRIFRNLRVPIPKPASGLYLIIDNNYTYRLRLSYNRLHIPEIDKKFRILQSCNGLLLCSTTSTPSRKLLSRYLVYNPGMKTFFKLPDTNWGLKKTEIITSITLAFDPNISSHYKVVCVVNELHQRVVNEKQQELLLYVHIYSSDTGLWKQVDKFFTCPVNSGAGVYWNGAIHWLYASVYFDIEGEMFYPLPSPPISWRIKSYIGESCDNLLYAKITRKGFGFQIFVYRMKTDHSSWSFVKCISVELGLKHPRANYSVLYVVLGEDEESSFVVFELSGRVMRKSFSPNTREEALCQVEGRRSSNDSIRAFQYIETTNCCV